MSVVAATAVAALLVPAAIAARAPIPWLDAPLPLWHSPPPKLIPYPASAPPCKAPQIAVRAGRSGAATGHLLEELVFTNIGRKACLLRGYPTVRATRVDGKQVVLHPRHGTFFGQLAAADAKPGGHVYLDFETDDECGNPLPPPVVYHDLVFTPRSGGDIRGGKAELRVVCGLGISEFGLQARYSGTAAPAPGTVASLQVKMTLPNSVRRGATLHYTVTLSNQTKRTVSFKSTSCPGYTQGIFTGIYAPVVQARGSYRLNCGSLRALAPGSSASFAMQLQVPARASLGLAKVGWSLDTVTIRAVGGTVTVVP